MLRTRQLLDLLGDAVVAGNVLPSLRSCSGRAIARGARDPAFAAEPSAELDTIDAGGHRPDRAARVARRHRRPETASSARCSAWPASSACPLTRARVHRAPPNAASEWSMAIAAAERAEQMARGHAVLAVPPHWLRRSATAPARRRVVRAAEGT
jgi:hypothetical protein